MSKEFFFDNFNTSSACEITLYIVGYSIGMTDFVSGIKQF